MRVSVGGTKIIKTKTRNKTLSPVWDNRKGEGSDLASADLTLLSFDGVRSTFHVTPHKAAKAHGAGAAPVRVESGYAVLSVWDEDMMSRDDKCGHCLVPLTDVFMGQQQGMQQQGGQQEGQQGTHQEGQGRGQGPRWYRLAHGVATQGWVRVALTVLVSPEPAILSCNTRQRLADLFPPGSAQHRQLYGRPFLSSAPANPTTAIVLPSSAASSAASSAVTSSLSYMPDPETEDVLEIVFEVVIHPYVPLFIWFYVTLTSLCDKQRTKLN